MLYFELRFIRTTVMRWNRNSVVSWLELWDNPLVTTTIDSKHRAVIKAFKPGDVLQIEEQSPDVVVLKRMTPASLPKPRLVRKNGRLVFVGGARLTSEGIKKMLEDFP
jgi:hypothetical protein